MAYSKGLAMTGVVVLLSLGTVVDALFFYSGAMYRLELED